MSEGAIPFPPRYRWLKRGLAVGLCVVLALAGLRWWWGRVAQRRIDAVIADAHAHGEPILPEDFPPEPAVPDSENAATTYLKAAAAVTMTPTERDWESFLEPAAAADFAIMRKIEADNRTALGLARIARGQHRVDWGPRPGPLGNPTLFGQLNYLRELSNILNYSARGEFDAGHDAGAIELLRDILGEARTMDARTGWLLTNFVGVGVGAGGVDSAISFSLALGIHPDRGARASLETSMRALIDDLLDEDGLIDSVAGELSAEASNSLVAGQSAAASTAWAPLPRIVATPLDWTMRPLAARQASEAALRLLADARAVRSPNLPAADAMPAGPPPAYRSNQSTLEAISLLLEVGGSYASANWQMMRYEFMAICDRRAAAVMLALRLYQFDHGDALPERLSDLVPRYLAALPADPMRADGSTFCYLPRANPPILYSVGLNGKDDGGSSALISGGYPGSWWNYLDAVYQLVPPAYVPSTTAPSTQAQYNN